MGWREFVRSRLRSAECDAAPSDQTWFQDLENRWNQKLQTRTEIAGGLQAESEGARRFQAVDNGRFRLFRL